MLTKARKNKYFYVEKLLQISISFMVSFRIMLKRSVQISHKIILETYCARQEMTTHAQFHEIIW